MTKIKEDILSSSLAELVKSVQMDIDQEKDKRRRARNKRKAALRKRRESRR